MTNPEDEPITDQPLARGSSEAGESEASPNERLKRELAHLSEQLPADEAARQALYAERLTALADRPLLTGHQLDDAVRGVSPIGHLAWIETRAVIGRTSRMPGGWSFEYDSRQGRAAKVAERLYQSATTPLLAEEVFHLEDKPDERIKLTAIEGPAGPMFLVDDGTHRMMGCMVAGLEYIPAEVKRIKYPILIETTSQEEMQDWEQKIQAGLIDGQLTTTTDTGGKPRYTLRVIREVVPWIRVQGEMDMTRISRAYEQLYPDALDQLEVPRDALIDPVAFNYYRAGRWQEWWLEHSQKPRNDDGTVRYH